MDQLGPELWMNVSDVFHIKGRGTVFTGRLEGQGRLNVGDMAMCEGVSWQVTAIEQFRATVTTADPGMDIGVLLKHGPPGILRNTRVYFQSKNGAAMGPQLSDLAPKKKRWRR